MGEDQLPDSCDTFFYWSAAEKANREQCAREFVLTSPS
jgi:hypothetical protein